MTTAFSLVFWLAVGFMFYSYVFYPVLLRLASVNKRQNSIVYAADDTDLPTVYVVFSVYNEEKIIGEKLESILKTNFSLNKLKVYVGSDCSSDRSNEIISSYASQNPQIVFVPFAERSGKSNVLNKIMAKIRESNDAPNDAIIIFTDANVIFSREVIGELAKHFKNPEIGLVGANILNKGVLADGISFQEKAYIQRENSLKYLEGLNWGTTMGAFGACYSMRLNCWKPIPPNYLMEDFYLTLNVLSLGKKAISEPKAICVEDVSNEVEEEYKRKSRIQAGNFQNLSSYWPLLFRFNAVSFCFFSHKVIRWTGPLLIVAAYVSNLGLLALSPFYVFTFVVQNLLLLSPVIDSIFKRFGVHLLLLRFASYFYLMNLALVNGFLMYMSGVKTNAWSPTKRNI